jgi:hypothetical protein
MYIKSVRNATNCYSFPHFHLTQHVSALHGHLQVSESVETATLHQCALDYISEDNTTRYWHEQKEKGKLQIAEELNNGLMKTKCRLLQQILGTRYSSE